MWGVRWTFLAIFLTIQEEFVNLGQNNPMMESFLPGLQHLQNFHPLVVHFPIAFLVGAELFYFLALIF
jgi:hypothetical protein